MLSHHLPREGEKLIRPAPVAAHPAGVRHAGRRENVEVQSSRFLRDPVHDPPCQIGKIECLSSLTREMSPAFIE
jgi:hypothetical protein